MKTKTMQNRVKSIRQHLKSRKLDSLIITKTPNVSYVTGFQGDDSWAVVTRRGVYLITDSRYTEQAASECSSCKIIERKTAIATAAGHLLGKLKSINTVGVEKCSSIETYSALKKHIDKRLRSIADLIEPVRAIKDSAEVAAIKEAGRIAGRALDMAIKNVRVGMTESYLAGALDFEIRKLGARNSFDTCVAFGPNASRPHHQPGSRKLKKNDTILIDFGAKYENYCSDITRCFTVGKESRFYGKVYATVLKAQRAAIELIRDGVSIKEVDAAARNVIDDSSLPVYGHGTGHGLGIEVHEHPTVSANTKGRLRAGMVITIEPGVYIPGKLGVRIEDDALVTSSGCHILTPITKERRL